MTSQKSIWNCAAKAAVAAGLLTCGCALQPPSPTQIDEALAFALAHSDLPPASPPKVYLASSYWMGAQIGISDSNRVRGLYLFSCKCIYLDQTSWTMPVLVHEMVHYLEDMAGLPAGHKRAEPVGELWAKLEE
jgi:hypothetical protein